MYPPSYLPTYLPTFLPTYLHTFLPTYLHTYIPTYLGDILTLRIECFGGGGKPPRLSFKNKTFSDSFQNCITECVTWKLSKLRLAGKQVCRAPKHHASEFHFRLHAPSHGWTWVPQYLWGLSHKESPRGKGLWGPRGPRTVHDTRGEGQGVTGRGA